MAAILISSKSRYPEVAQKGGRGTQSKDRYMFLLKKNEGRTFFAQIKRGENFPLFEPNGQLESRFLNLQGK